MNNTGVLIKVETYDSSNLHDFVYSTALRVLRVTFRSTAVYDYFDVPVEKINEWTNLILQGESVGQHFNRIIKKGGYEYREV